MNDQSWIDKIEWVSLEFPDQIPGDEEIYTLKINDFLQMPDLNFVELALYDPEIRALMN